ncbi:IS3 family transposase [Gilliamella sp. Pas-s27]|uniref:IS3 family transposase n=1 Tax=Gilliamella sp. Pas-s27 TaxID=2687311 RepID=UPI00136589C5|nr:IS3 family transposase [Gilliamella sp. Pas-s27]MWP47794.1 IS3 family transposase [Gilliamella sp. Pas-s27]
MGYLQFHSDRDKEFDNLLLENCFKTFNITHSLNKKGGGHYDNAVAEATFKTIKTEFLKGQRCNSMVELQRAFSAYTYWYNHKRLHSSLGYLSPVEFKKHLPP